MIAHCRSEADKDEPAGSLDSDPGVRPQAHRFAGSRAPWLAITDALPQFPEYPT